MRTVGQTLRESRLDKLLTLEEVEKHTKIRVELLEALEADDYQKLPPATFVQGFIKNYGKYLDEDINKLMALFRRDYEAKKHPPQVLESFSKPIKQKKFRLTPAKVFGTVVAIIIISFFSYLWIEYRQFVGTPNLDVTSPTQAQSVDLPEVLVAGKTDPDSTVAVNDQEIGVDPEGKFSESIKLSSSVNTITITSTSKFGQAAKVERTVYVKK